MVRASVNTLVKSTHIVDELNIAQHRQSQKLLRLITLKQTSLEEAISKNRYYRFDHC